MKLELFFSEVEMREFLQSRGWVMQVIREESEVNVYQNVFVPEVLLMEYYFKDGRRESLAQAFREEMKLKLLMA